MEERKPVGILLRVSTSMQARVGDNEADIPTQRTACVRFIEKHPEWQLVKEYREIGVSGYKNSISKRDKLLEVQEDIANRHIQVLVVFMFDRLGRIEEETPFVVKRFVEMGCEVWSVLEGQRKFEAHVDSLLNFITFWQASGESKKTSERVTNAMSQMAEAGAYTGGPPPFGYTTAETGNRTKKKLPEKKLAVLEQEADVVRLIYRLALHKDYGCHRIARWLNENMVPSRSGKPWGHAVVGNVLSNPVYKGQKCYNRTTTKGAKSQRRLPPDSWIVGPRDPELAIIPEADWNLVQERRAARMQRQQRRKAENQTIPDGETVKSRLLLAGIAHCGICGAKMYTGYSPCKWVTRDGVVHRRHNPVYRCSTRLKDKTACSGQLSYRPDTFEPAVLHAVDQYLRQLQAVDLSQDIKERLTHRRSASARTSMALEKKCQELTRGIQVLEDRYVRALVEGPEQDASLLRRLLARQEAELLEIREQRKTSVARRESGEGSGFSQGAAHIPPWADLFARADADTRKSILRHLIQRVDVTGDTVSIRFRVPPGDSIPLADAPAGVTPLTPTRRETP